MYNTEQKKNSLEFSDKMKFIWNYTSGVTTETFEILVKFKQIQNCSVSETSNVNMLRSGPMFPLIGNDLAHAKYFCISDNLNYVSDNLKSNVNEKIEQY